MSFLPCSSCSFSTCVSNRVIFFILCSYSCFFAFQLLTSLLLSFWKRASCSRRSTSVRLLPASCSSCLVIIRMFSPFHRSSMSRSFFICSSSSLNFWFSTRAPRTPSLDVPITSRFCFCRSATNVLSFAICRSRSSIFALWFSRSVRSCSFRSAISFCICCCSCCFRDGLAASLAIASTWCTLDTNPVTCALDGPAAGAPSSPAASLPEGLPGPGSGTPNCTSRRMLSVTSFCSLVSVSSTSSDSCLTVESSTSCCSAMAVFSSRFDSRSALCFSTSSRRLARAAFFSDSSSEWLLLAIRVPRES
mmetsp:Transcript_28182/g.71521  ORF Transcript_28182/g.71521 Transcript_28182/m.71521 type:complete len:305 (-) Transcript_28182:384-1298(-)